MAQVIDLPMDLSELLYVLGPTVLSVSTVGAWITAIISLERCCCVLRPVKVKQILTRKTIIVMIVGMSVFQTVTLIARMSVLRFTAVYSTARNRWRLVFDYASLENTVYVSLTFWAASFVSAICLVLIIISTTFLRIALRERETQRGGCFHCRLYQMRSEEQKKTWPAPLL